MTAIRFFRIDRAQESLHYVLDICEDNHLYIVFDESDALDAMDEEEEEAVEEMNLDDVKPESATVAPAQRSPEVTAKDLEGEMADSFPAVRGSEVRAESRLSNSRDHNENIARSPSGHSAVGVKTSNELIVPNGSHHSSVTPQPSPTVQQVLEKTTEGILKGTCRVVTG